MHIKTDHRDQKVDFDLLQHGVQIQLIFGVEIFKKWSTIPGKVMYREFSPNSELKLYPMVQPSTVDEEKS